MYFDTHPTPPPTALPLTINNCVGCGDDIGQKFNDVMAAKLPKMVDMKKHFFLFYVLF